MSNNLLSTHAVAAMLDVAETTVKRWADEQIIPCIRTPGGHRKFPLREVVHFAEKNGYSLDGSRPPPMTQEQVEQLEFGVHTRNYSRIAGVFREEALQADRKGLLTLLLYLYKRHIPPATIIDEVIRPAFEVIGTLWEEGTLEVHQEHAASHAVIESLSRMSSEIYHKGPNGLTALCACLEGELHEIGLRGLSHSLEYQGWNVRYLGANTPLDTLTSCVSSISPDLVCLSFTAGKQDGTVHKKLRMLSTRIHVYHGKIIIGGRMAGQLDKEHIGCDYIAGSVEEGVTFSRDAFRLKPGPKKKSA
jgi:MerR family transcriptional regulator, light-induced transcriptional regulator